MFLRNLFKQTLRFTSTTDKNTPNQRHLRQQKLKQLLEEKISPSIAIVEDTTLDRSACGQMYKFHVKSQLFEGKSRLDQHKMVTNALGDEVKAIHGMSIKTEVIGKEEKK